MEKKKNNTYNIIKKLEDLSLEPIDCNEYLTKINTSVLNQKTKAKQIVLRPSVSLDTFSKNVSKVGQLLDGFDKFEIEQAETQIKYETYINKEIELVKKFNELENLLIPSSFDYNKINALSAEAKQKFNKIRPTTLGQASRISGVNPSDIQILLVYMGR